MNNNQRTYAKYDPNRKWIIEVTEEQLYDIINDVEDIHRFLAGQTELWNVTSNIRDFERLHTIRQFLDNLHPLVTPELDRCASYGWDGGGCPDELQRNKIRRGYAIWRNLRHCIEKYRQHDEWNVYQGETLTCGVPLAICYPKTEE